MILKNIRTFLPTKDLHYSKQYYIDLGFPVQWESEDLIIMGTEQHNFFLQKAYLEEWANNMMLQLHVENLDALYDVAKKLKDVYPETKLKSIFTADYGRTFHLLDPAGVLWHMTERK